MTNPVSLNIIETDIEQIAQAEGRVAVIITPDGKMDLGARRANRLTKGALSRMIEKGAIAKMKPGEVTSLAWPAGMKAEALDVICLERNAKADTLRRAGVALGKVKGTADVLVLAGPVRQPGELLMGLVLRAYEFTAHKTKEAKVAGAVTLMTSKPETVDIEALQAVAKGVFFTRDLVSEPANHLTTTEFANRIEAMKELGLKVSVLDEPELEKLGMGALLSVGHGSASPSKVAIMEWMGGDKGAAPLALVGKGVVFDTGGISIKPAAGMEDMTMDMGGAGVVAGVMRTLALRKARANVVGIVGLVENMPSDRATRPGDVVTSMKGDTIEVINTDAEGRLVLADILWHAQEKYKPAAMINLATLTGAVIVALGHENAGVFTNDDAFCSKFLKAAEAEGEGAWQLPMGEAYDKKLESRIADIQNVGGKSAGSITAAQFLRRFVKDETPWIHLDIAGVALIKEDSTYAPKGATGWGVMALNRLISEQFEG
jgi:leucyl aminopeptidase